MSAAIPLTLPSLRKAYSEGIDPADIIEQVFARIEDVADPNIFLCLFSKEQVQFDAKALGPYDPDKPLWGVPFVIKDNIDCLLYTSPSPRDLSTSRMPSSA